MGVDQQVDTDRPPRLHAQAGLQLSDELIIRTEDRRRGWAA
jgi:hypothetical protein